MTEEIPKPFGFPDDKGFYKVNEANELALETAVKLVNIWNGKIEFLALSGYIDRDYPDDTKEEDYDWRYNLIAGVDPSLSQKDRSKFVSAQSTQKEFELAYEQARNKMYWHHKPRLVIWDDVSVQKKIKNKDIESLIRGSLFHSLVASAVPLWDKPKTFTMFKEYALTPFEYLQQTVFQFNKSCSKSPIFVARVTDDKASRYVFD